MEKNKGFIKDETKFVIFPIMVLSLFFIILKISSVGLLIIVSFIFIMIYIFKFIKSKLSKKNKQEEKYNWIIASQKESNQLIVLFFVYYLLKINFRESEAIFSGIFMIIFIFIVIKSEFINKKQEKVNISIEDNLKLSKKEIIKTYVKKELIKMVLIYPLTISLMIFNLSVAWYGSLTEYLHHRTLRLFVDTYYLRIALDYGQPTNEYFTYITNYLKIDLYLWIIPFCMGIIHMYIAYWIVHKIVDRSGIGATKRLNFVYFFFIFGISNILSRLFANDVIPTLTEISITYDLWWYIFYKIIKISVLKIEENLKRGE